MPFDNSLENFQNLAKTDVKLFRHHFDHTIQIHVVAKSY